MRGRTEGLSIVLDLVGAVLIVSVVFATGDKNTVELSGVRLWCWAVLAFVGTISTWRRCADWCHARTGKGTLRFPW